MTQRYSFGKNWQRFLKTSYDDERESIARRHILEALHLNSFENKTFLDIGCGSGLHSLAALRAGSAKILSLDFDPDSVQATKILWQNEGSPEHWTIEQADVLDRARMSGIGTWDIVYSWGVLHHTGNVWNAFRNAMLPLEDNGVLFIALYTTDVVRNTDDVLSMKRRYVAGSAVRRRFMEMRFIWHTLIRPNLRPSRLRIPVDTILGYRKHRGMSFMTDVRDWLGGWPMEFTSVAETREFSESQLGLRLIACYGGAANTEYLFCRAEKDKNFSLAHPSRGPDILVPPFKHLGGHAFFADAPLWLGEKEYSGFRSLILKENDQVAGPSGAETRQIKDFGSGAVNGSAEGVIFSTIDNTDPNTNGRIYTIESVVTDVDPNSS